MKSVYDLEFLTPGQVAAAMQVCDTTVMREIRRGNLKAVKIGKKYRITQANFREYLKGETDEQQS